MVRGPYEEVIMKVAVSRDMGVDDVYRKIHKELLPLSRNLEHIEVYDHSLWTSYASPTYQAEGEGEEEEDMPSPEIEEHYPQDMHYDTGSYDHEDHYHHDENYGDEGDAYPHGQIWDHDDLWEQEHGWEEQVHTDADYDHQQSARRVRQVMEKAKHKKQKQHQDMPRGGATADASVQTDITVAPPSRTPAMLDPTTLFDDEDLTQQHLTQIVVIEAPPTPRRLVTLRLPLSLTVEECLQRAAAGLHVSPNDCILRTAGPTSEVAPVMGENHQQHTPPNSASMMRTLRITWRTCTTGSVVTYYRRLWSVGDLTAYLGRHFGPDRTVHAYQDGILLDPEIRLYQLQHEDIMLDDIPTPRGGARSRRQPQQQHSTQQGGEAVLRQAMHNGALHKVTQACPSLDERLIRTILKAEARTTTALINSRSDQQVRHIIAAAFKRSGLVEHARAVEASHQTAGSGSGEELSQDQQQQQSPQQQDPLLPQPPGVQQQQAQSSVQQQQDSMMEQVQSMMQQMEASAAQIYHMEQSIGQMMILLQTQYVAAMRFDLTPLIQALAHSQQQWQGQMQQVMVNLKQMDSRVQQWETTFLPCVMERLAEIQPPPTTPETPSEAQRDMPSESQPTSATVNYDSASASSAIIERATQRSLQACCAKVVQPPRKALKPFARP